MGIDTILSDARSLITLLSFLTFIGIMWWTYVRHKPEDFDQAANLPFADTLSHEEEGKHHG